MFVFLPLVTLGTWLHVWTLSSGSRCKIRWRCLLKPNSSSHIKRNSWAAKLTGSRSSNNCRNASSKDPSDQWLRVCQGVMSVWWCHCRSSMLNISLWVFHLLKNLQLILCKGTERDVSSQGSLVSLGHCSLMLRQFFARCVSHKHQHTPTDASNCDMIVHALQCKLLMLLRLWLRCIHSFSPAWTRSHLTWFEKYIIYYFYWCKS